MSVFTVVTSTRQKVPESFAPVSEKVTEDGENGLWLSYSPAKSVAALQEVTETHRVMVHLQVRGAAVGWALCRRVKDTECSCCTAVCLAKLTAKLTASQVTHSSCSKILISSSAHPLFIKTRIYTLSDTVLVILNIILAKEKLLVHTCTGRQLASKSVKSEQHLNLTRQTN